MQLRNPPGHVLNYFSALVLILAMILLRHMKKILLSGAVIALFVAYSLSQRHESSEVAQLSAPPNLSPLPTATPTPTETPPTTTRSAGSTPTPTATPTPTPSGAYKNGTYTGVAADAFYGNIQVKATVSGGRLTDVTFLQYPNDRSTSREINSQAMPWLRQEAIQVQNAQVDIVSGATDSSLAFRQSLQSALSQAK